ncbi:MAG: protein adenylyltransferase SelO family protein, partial [Pseudomonadota bacterium]
MPFAASYAADTPFANLGEGYADPVDAADFPEARLRFRNDRWARRVGLGDLTEAEWIAHFARFAPLPGNIPRPLATRYHGHQFQVYNPDLGDGRGFLFAQLRDAEDGRLLDLGTKGSGQTPYSRAGDGRLTLKGGVREILATEMLEALGVYTSKTFSLIETGEQLHRGDEPSPTRSAVLVRLNHSHVRFGSFQRLAYFEEAELMRGLVDYCAEHLIPEAAEAEGEERVAKFLQGVAVRSARLAASWMAAGFVHGVLN